MTTDYPVDPLRVDGGTADYVLIDGIPVVLGDEPKPYAPTVKFGHGVYA